MWASIYPSSRGHASTKMTFLWVILFLAFAGRGEATERPIIGIMTQELIQPVRNYSSFLPASYVKAVEGSGARVVPIFINMTEPYYRDILSKVNGVIFPGGMADLHAKNGIAEAAKIVYNIIIETNSKGVRFPLLGVCQGNELLAFISNKGNDILTKCDALKINLPLRFKPDFRNSSLYSMADTKDISILATLPVTANHHQFCLTEKNLTRYGLIGKTWKVLSTNNDLSGLEFVSSMEHAKHPIAGVQFHPEKNAYEWQTSQDNPHSAKAIQTGRLFYDWLVRQARLNNHSFPDSKSEMDSLIYNYNPIYANKLKCLGTQNYFFYHPPAFNGAYNAASNESKNTTLNAFPIAASKLTFSNTSIAATNPTLNATIIASFLSTSKTTKNATLNAFPNATTKLTFSNTSIAATNPTLNATKIASFLSTSKTTKNATLNATSIATKNATLNATSNANKNATLNATINATHNTTTNAIHKVIVIATYNSTSNVTFNATTSATNRKRVHYPF